MCLGRELRQDEQDELKEQAKRRGYWRVYKVVKKRPFDNRRMTGPHYGVPYRAGMRRSNWPGWHVFLSEKTARNNVFSGRKFVCCYAKPSWLRKLAYDNSSRRKAATFHTLVFPEWAKGDMTIREFRAACRKGGRR